jgi:hypothetical protein
MKTGEAAAVCNVCMRPVSSMQPYQAVHIPTSGGQGNEETYLDDSCKGAMFGVTSHGQKEAIFTQRTPFGWHPHTSNSLTHRETFPILQRQVQGISLKESPC